MSHPTAILDIGTSKVICLIGSKGSHGLLEVYGTGCKEHGGLRKQTFLNQQSLREAIGEAIHVAEDEARRVIKTVSIGVPASMLRTICNRTTISYKSSHTIIIDDEADMIARSLALDHPGDEWSHLQSMVERYEVNGAVFKKIPIGTSTGECTGVVSNTYFRREFKILIQSILSEMNIEVDAFVDAIYAETMLLCSETDALQDVVMIDIGYYQTDIIVLRNQAILYRTGIEIGGQHMANDIHYVLDILPSVAEEVKRRHVFGLDYMEQSDTYQRTNGSLFDCNYEMIQNIIESRALEIAILIGEELKKTPIEVNKKTKIYISGGGLLMMRGGYEFLQAEVGLPLIAPTPVLPKRNSANYYSAYGVLEAMLRQKENQKKMIWNKSVVRAVIDFFTK